MIKSYDEFIDALNKKIKNDEDLIYELLITVIKNPNRYTGIFRLTNAKTKLIQNVTQSREIKFGDFMEDIITEYIAEMGYTNLDKNIGTDEDGNALSADQVFIKDNTVYLIEQKIRDDHDSTKKRGQYANFKKKYTLLLNTFPEHTVHAIMWFIDDNLTKNRNYYVEQAYLENALMRQYILEKANNNSLKIDIFYGGDLFDSLFKRPDAWKEICEYLRKNKQGRSTEILYIPDFDESDEVRNAIKKLKEKEPSLYRKLTSDKPEYIQLRNELFPTGKNLK